jgi:hypothetical protein
MLDPAHPVAILRAAWRTVGLDVIRAAGRATIAELEAQYGAKQLEHCGPDRITASTAALRACCDELREESGLSATPETQERARWSTEDTAWRSCFAAELTRYRTVAGVSLRRWLGAA